MWAVPSGSKALGLGQFLLYTEKLRLAGDRFTL
jgi:hypothetical protein